VNPVVLGRGRTMFDGIKEKQWREGGTHVRRVTDLVGRVKADSRLEWLVVITVLALLALAFAVGWIDLGLPRPF
ncbi:MAG: hypothetical protein ACT4PY_08990, partial [Armatimonadota bacterium]